jgi:hypothetical protein
MGPSEYVLVFVSLILGLGIGDMLISLHRILRAGRQVRWDWAAPWTAIIVILLNVQTWWSLFPRGKDAPMTIAGFLPLLVTLILLFLLSAASLPDEASEAKLDLKAYYDGNRRYFWSLMTLVFAWNIGSDLIQELLGGRPLLRALADRPLDIVVLALFASLIFVGRRWWHALVLLLAMAGPVTWLSRSVG